MTVHTVEGPPGGFAMEPIIDGKGVTGHEEARPKLVIWLTKKLANPETEEGIVVHLYRASTGEDQIRHKVAIGLGENLDDVAGEILEAADEEAQATLGTVKFICKVEGDPKVFFRFSLKVTPSKADDPDYYDSGDLEPATERGVLGLLMRHANANGRLAYDMMQTFAADASETKREMREHIRHQQSTIDRLMETYERAASGAFVRDMELRRFEREEERKDKGVQILAGLAPTIAQVALTKMLGPGAAQFFPAPAPDAARADLQRLAARFMTMPDEQKVAVYNALPEEFRGELGEILSRHLAAMGPGGPPGMPAPGGP